MDSLKNRLKDPQYANWVKNTLALEITNEVLKPYVVQEISNIHALIVSNCPSGATCRLCECKNAESCPKNVCNVIKREIKNSHRFSRPSFNITNPKQWIADSWEIAKCFMPPNPRNKYCTCSDADFSAVVNIIINHKHFEGHVSCDLGRTRNIFDEAREMRNKVMHLSVYNIDETDFQNNLDLLINLLDDFKTQLPTSPEAIKKLNELKRGKLQITSKNAHDAHEQAVRAYWEEVDKGKDEIRKYVRLAIQEIEQTSNETALQIRLRANFIKGCKHSLIKLVKSHIDSLKPEDYPQDKWTLSKFLKRIQLSRDIECLPDRHKRLLYPDLGKQPDVSNWDLFLLCHILSIEKSIPLPNNLENYIKEVKTTRDNILGNPADFGIENLEELIQYLDEPLSREVKGIFMDSGEYRRNENPLQLQHTLQSWTHTEDIMDNRKVSYSVLNEQKKQARQIQELQQEIKQIREAISISAHTVTDKGVNDCIETNVEITTKYCSREDIEKLQNNIFGEDGKENIAHTRGGINCFRTESNVEGVQPAKGSIILKVTCKSTEDLMLFWDSCMDGRAVGALSKLRDDYRQFLDCYTLEFDIVLTRKEVNRCINHLVERLSSQLQDERFREIRDRSATAEPMKVREAGTLMPGRGTPGLGEDRPEIPYTSAVEGGEEVGLTSLEVPEIPERTEGSESITGDTKRPSLDVHRQVSDLDTLKKDAKYSEEDATRLTKFLEEIAEHFEEGKISVIKPYLQKMIKHSKDRDREAFEEDIMDFTEATKFRSGITVHLMKQALRGFRMILNEPEFGDLLAAKVEAIEKEEELIGGEDTKAWLMDPKNSAIMAEDIQVGDKVEKDRSRTSDTLSGKRFGTAGPSKESLGYDTMKQGFTFEPDKFSPDPTFKQHFSMGHGKLGQPHTQKTGSPTSLTEEKIKSREKASSVRIPGLVEPTEATETLPKS